jgi:hypothetical protein
MATVVNILILLLPVMVLCLLAGLGLCIAVLANEGRGWTSGVSQIVGLINLLMIVPLTLLSWAAETRDVRFMFMFAAGVFALVGLFGVRLPARFDD